MAEVFKNYIDGAWVEAKSGKTFENRNPANRHDLIGLFPASSLEDVNGAVQAAKEGVCTLAPRAGAKKGRDPLPGGRAFAPAKGRDCSRHDPGDGQNLKGDAGRRPGGD